jgi:hypothetical protein
MSKILCKKYLSGSEKRGRKYEAAGGGGHQKNFATSPLFPSYITAVNMVQKL